MVPTLWENVWLFSLRVVHVVLKILIIKRGLLLVRVVLRSGCKSAISLWRPVGRLAKISISLDSRCHELFSSSFSYPMRSCPIWYLFWLLGQIRYVWPVFSVRPLGIYAIAFSLWLQKQVSDQTIPISWSATLCSCAILVIDWKVSVYGIQLYTHLSEKCRFCQNLRWLIGFERLCTPIRTRCCILRSRPRTWW